jgi:selenocysteine-specific elongation factor
MKVIATAGHVDHGKSTLVRALTGMEPDRWAEERRRGMTIDLGYAWLTLPGGDQVAFVDVPGHERFVPNMLAGLGPVPAVMFVVAADGGWMPQSAEHLAAIDALGVRHGLLVVTRADLADPGPALHRAAAEIAATSLGRVESVTVSAVTGSGLPDLTDALVRLASVLSAAEHGSGKPVRLWLDRSFTVKGSGTVVTGTLPSGTVRVGQELLLTPSMLPVRVRSLQALGEPADEVSGVARVALNLRGVPRDVPERGMALVEPGRWTLTSQVDVRVHQGVTPSSGLPERLPAQPLVHVGSARTPARLRMLHDPGGRPPVDPRLRGEDPPDTPLPGGTGTDRRPPGLPPAGLGQTPSPPGSPASVPTGLGSGDPIFARLTFRDPLPLHVGDRILLRDPGTVAVRGALGDGSGGALILGATVLDVAPPALRRRGGGAAAARELAQWPAVPGAHDLLRRHGMRRASTLAAMGVTGLPAPVAGDWLADPDRWSRLRGELPKAVADFARRNPLAPGMPLEAARAALDLPDRHLVTALAAGTLTLDGGYLRLAGQAAVVALPPRVAEGVRKVLGELGADPFAAPDAPRLRELGLDAKALATAARAGLLLRITPDVVLAPGADQEAAAVLARLPQPFTTSQARQALRTSRRVAIPLLEYLDRARVTERLPGDLRQMR